MLGEEGITDLLLIALFLIEGVVALVWLAASVRNWLLF